jgi:hypothetical protein
VDIVIRLDDCFQSDRNNLDPQEKAAWTVAYPGTVSYGYTDFRADVLAVLLKAFPGAVTVGDKAFSIKAEGNRRKADVLPCLNFKRYYKFNSRYDQGFHSGICFYDKGGNLISNYPNQHCENLTRKHQSSGLRLKPTVRMLKNLREDMIEKKLLDVGVAPSYYLEGLLYNVPDELFSTSLGDTFCDAINWIQQRANKSALVTANEQFYLLRDNLKTCWPKANGEAFLNAAITLWNSW